MTFGIHSGNFLQGGAEVMGLLLIVIQFMCDQCKSGVQNQGHGLHQGCPLSLILFVVFINKISKHH